MGLYFIHRTVDFENDNPGDSDYYFYDVKEFGPRLGIAYMFRTGESRARLKRADYPELNPDAAFGECHVLSGRGRMESLSQGCSIGERPVRQLCFSS